MIRTIYIKTPLSIGEEGIDNIKKEIIDGRNNNNVNESFEIGTMHVNFGLYQDFITPFSVNIGTLYYLVFSSYLFIKSFACINKYLK